MRGYKVKTEKGKCASDSLEGTDQVQNLRILFQWRHRVGFILAKHCVNTWEFFKDSMHCDFIGNIPYRHSLPSILKFQTFQRESRYIQHMHIDL
jgi:hypothetical protein